MAKEQVYKALLAQHDKLRKTASATLFDRVSILKRVYEDPHYLADVGKSGKTATAELDGRVSDSCANFIELLQMLKMFPKRADWENGDLASMRSKMLEAIRNRQREQNGKAKANGKEKKKLAHRRSATLNEVREMKVEIKEKKTEVEHLREQLAEKSRMIASLEKALESSRETIGSLNETISLLKIERERNADAAR